MDPLRCFALVDQTRCDVNLALSLEIFEQLGTGSNPFQVTVISIVDNPSPAERVRLHPVFKWFSFGNPGLNLFFAQTQVQRQSRR